MDSMELMTRMDQATPATRERIEPLLGQIEKFLDQDADDAAWAQQLGPAYTQDQVATVLGKSKQAVSADKALLRLTMRNGRIGYPVFQFDGDTVVSGVREVVEILTPVVASTWTIASWLTSREPGTGRTAMDQLRDGQIDEAVSSARRSAQAMAQ